ncbi:MAG: ECF-family polymerase sigma factor [Myxococcaceae bacterium]|nr:ECF-family polymerase sigma factor [Myxococcaceae bacterium]
MSKLSSYEARRSGEGATILRSEAFQWSDTALVVGVRAGDRTAKEALFDRYAPYVRAIVVRLLGFRGEVADLVHDVFVAALEDIDGLQNAAALKSWLTSIAVFKVRHHIRSKSRRRWLTFMQPDELPEQIAVHAEPETQRALALAYQILAELDVDERVAFTLRYVEGMELKEVAAACRISLATSKRRIKRAEERFRAKAATQPALCAWLESSERGSKS